MTQPTPIQLHLRVPPDAPPHILRWRPGLTGRWLLPESAPQWVRSVWLAPPYSMRTLRNGLIERVVWTTR